MANKYQVLDQILTSDQGATGNYNIVFTTLEVNDEDEGTQVIQAISDKIKENINYSDLQNAPGIPQEGYEELNGELQPTKSFNKIAFTGQYNHLIGAPGIPEEGRNPNGTIKELNPIAFTGSIDLENIKVSNVINFFAADFAGSLESFGIKTHIN